MSKCSICGAEIKNEEPAILALGVSGTPRYICDECEADLDEAKLGSDVDSISAAIKSLSNKMLHGNSENEDKSKDMDGLTYHTMTKIISNAIARAKKIKDGEYDFSLDEQDDGFDEIPEELQETEEDKELDRIDAEKEAKRDKVFNIILIIALVGFVAVLAWRLIDMFLLK